MKYRKYYLVPIIFLICLFIGVKLIRYMNYEEDTAVMLYYEYYNILKVSNQPLFRPCGTINQNVLNNLMDILNDERLDPMLRESNSVWPEDIGNRKYTAITAADFSDFVVSEPKNSSHSGAIVIKLFETLENKEGVENGHLTEFTNQWWQLVYRSTDNIHDVLTLWMMQPYRVSAFNGTRYDNVLGRRDEIYYNRTTDEGWEFLTGGSRNTIISDARLVLNLPACNNFFFENNYSASIARANLLRDFEIFLNNYNVRDYIVYPINLPGNWQNSRYQTGTNYFDQFYATNQFNIHGQDFPGSTYPEGGLGASGLIWGRIRHFSLINGKDGLSVGPVNNHWAHTRLSSTDNDLIWLPSDFEVRTMGHDKETQLFQTFIEEPNNPESRLRTNVDYDVGNRTGLWQLNGFDRGFDASVFNRENKWENNLVWLRSVDGLAIGSANTIYHTGNRYSYGVNQLAGLRPALHLSLTNLNS